MGSLSQRGSRSGASEAGSGDSRVTALGGHPGTSCLWLGTSMVGCSQAQHKHLHLCPLKRLSPVSCRQITHLTSIQRSLEATSSCGGFHARLQVSSHPQTPGAPRGQPRGLWGDPDMGCFCPHTPSSLEGVRLVPWLPVSALTWHWQDTEIGAF